MPGLVGLRGVEREGEEQGAGQGGEQQVDGDEREVGVACGGEGQPPREGVADRGRRVRLVGREVDPLQGEGEVRRVPGRRKWLRVGTRGAAAKSDTSDTTTSRRGRSLTGG